MAENLPSVLSCLVGFFIEKACQKGSFLYNGINSAPGFLLSLTGFDGYLLFAYPKAYYIAGEWFLGALIILRLLFPFILFWVKKNKTRAFMIGTCIILYVISFLFPLTSMYRMRTIPYCLFCFMLGVAIQRFCAWKRKTVVVLSAICLICCFLIDLPDTRIEIYTPLAGANTVLITLWLGKTMMRNPFVSRICSMMSRLSYNIFCCSILLFIKSSQVIHLKD